MVYKSRDQKLCMVFGPKNFVILYSHSEASSNTQCYAISTINLQFGMWLELP